VKREENRELEIKTSKNWIN